MFNIDQASKFLNVSKTSLRRWEKEGKMNYHYTKDVVVSTSQAQCNHSL